jgi:polyhydroxyalkanoate synthesis regulator protein
LWENNLQSVCEYIYQYFQLPSRSDKNEKIKQLGQWISDQKRNYKNKKGTMKNEEIFNKFTHFFNEYKEYFICNEELWQNKLQSVVEYINHNSQLPSGRDKNKKIKHLGNWLYHQKINHKNKQQIMVFNSKIFNKFTDFLKEYEEYFMSNEELWQNKLQSVVEYINHNSQLPSSTDKNKKIKKIGVWISVQKRNYKNQKEIMKNEHIYNAFTNFLKNYEEYFLSNEELWQNKLRSVCEYIYQYSQLPSRSDKNEKIKHLGKWISHQKQNYKNKKFIMKNEQIFNKFTELLIKYKQYFNNFNQVL